MALERDPAVYLMGEDIGVYGGAFQVTGDLVERFGEDRVMDMPISELAGAGVVGRRRADGHEADLRVPVFRFRDARHGADRQPGRQDPLHAGRRRLGPARHAFSRRLRHGGCGAAFAVARSLVRPCSGTEGRPAGDAVRCQGHAAGGDRGSRPGDDLRAQAALQDEGAGAGRLLYGSPRQGRGGQDRTACHRGRHLRSWCTRRWRRRNGSPRKG